MNVELDSLKGVDVIPVLPKSAARLWMFLLHAETPFLCSV